MSRRRLFVIVSTIMVLTGVFIWYRGAERQSHACFTNLSEAFASGRASAILSEIHSDYNFPAHWPQVFSESEGTEPRVTALRALMYLCQMYRETPLSLAVDIQSVEAQADGTTVVIATLNLSASGRDLPFSLGPIHHHRFILARDGMVAMHILRHDPIAFSR